MFTIVTFSWNVRLIARSEVVDYYNQPLICVKVTNNKVHKAPRSSFTDLEEPLKR
jgi:hypothetical protein